MPEPTSVVEMMAMRFDVAADQTFVIDSTDGRELSYLEMVRRAARLGFQLDRVGLVAGDVVAVWLANEPAWIVASVACWSRRLIVAAVSGAMPAGEASRLVARSGARAVVIRGDRALKAMVDVPCIDVGIVEERPAGTRPDDEGTDDDVRSVLAIVDPDDEAVIFYTSGTTGEPKAIPASHRRLAAGARAQAASYASQSTFRPTVAPSKVPPIVSFTAFGHAAAYGSFALALWVGRRLALVTKFSVEQAKLLVEGHGVDVLRLNPAAIHMLATTGVEIDLSKLRYVYSGTAPLSARTRQLFGDRYDVPILEGYGQSETGAIALARIEDVTSGRQPPTAVGRVLADVELRIVDADGRAVPAGVEGEIQVRTPTMAAGVATTDDGFVRTGDAGIVDTDGFLQVTGRVTDKMVVGGFNVFPGEVEEVLRQSALVRDAVVVGLPDDRLGDRPVAGIVWSHRDPAALEAFARTLLAAYKVPREWFDVDSVPITDRGKVDRRAALALLLAGGER